MRPSELIESGVGFLHLAAKIDRLAHEVFGQSRIRHRSARLKRGTGGETGDTLGRA